MDQVGLRRVVALANERHRRSWLLAGRLAGGYSDAGAHELRDADGARAVLKWHAGPIALDRVQQTARVVAEAISAGWATPRWLAHGALEDGSFYVIEEHIDGTAPDVIDDHQLDLILQTIAVQADLVPVTDRDWSAYARDTVFHGAFGFADRMRTARGSAELLRRLEDITRGTRDVGLATADVVHGDFTPHNLLLVEGKAVVVDAEFAGKGTRAYDLATLLHTVVTDGRVASGTTVVERLRSECERLVGADGLKLCVAARMMGVVAFGFDHWPADVDGYVGRCHAFLDLLDT